MTDQDRKAHISHLKNLTQQVANSSTVKVANQILEKAGMLTKNGNIKPAFRGEVKKASN